MPLDASREARVACLARYAAEGRGARLRRPDFGLVLLRLLWGRLKEGGDFWPVGLRGANPVGKLAPW
jgi:hypothetical protein